MTCPHCGCTLFFDCECPETVAIFEDAIDSYHDDIVLSRREESSDVSL